MKVEVKENTQELEKKTRYPWIGISENGVIVLFTHSSSGICLQKGIVFNSYRIGDFKDDWMELHFKPFEDEIVLSNS